MIIRKATPKIHIRQAGEQYITLFKTKIIIIPLILIIISFNIKFILYYVQSKEL